MGSGCGFQLLRTVIRCMLERVKLGHWSLTRSKLPNRTNAKLPCTRDGSLATKTSSSLLKPFLHTDTPFPSSPIKDLILLASASSSCLYASKAQFMFSLSQSMACTSSFGRCMFLLGLNHFPLFGYYQEEGDRSVASS